MILLKIVYKVSILKAKVQNLKIYTNRIKIILTILIRIMKTLRMVKIKILVDLQQINQK